MRRPLSSSTPVTALFSKQFRGQQSVGVPVAEKLLTEAVCRSADELLRPGSGRSLMVLEEVELGIGRPDLMLLSASRRGLEARARAGLRLTSLTEARVLAALKLGRSPGISQGHLRRVTKRLEAAGWIRPDGYIRDVPPVVAQSIVLEAKLRDWRGGLHQLARTRWAAHYSALILPASHQGLVSRVALRNNRLGLLVIHGESLRWQIRPRSRPLSWLGEVWLAELAIRQLEADS